MTIEDFLHISQIGIETAMYVAAPVLIAGLAAGLTVSVVQAATQVSDSALAFIPKILATIAALLIFGSWMIAKLATFTTYVFNQIPNVTS